MAASRFLQCRNILTSNITLMCTSKWTTKTFSILSLSHKVSQKCNPIQSLKILSKPKLKIEFLSRKTATAAATSTPAAAKTVSENFIRKRVGFWLLGCSGLVYTTICIGAYTRLTESGLSMVTWRFTFENFPNNDEEWQAEFEKYKQFPEFKMLKKDLTMEEFKSIFKTEYIHRSMGRFLGLFFILPALGFWLTGRFKEAMKIRVIGFTGLILSQGLLGWYMVKSGLEDKFHKETDIPRVSQYRLASHLGLALILYTGFLLTAMELLLPIQKPSSIMAGARKLRMLAHSCKGLVFLTAISGAFVAGLDAGLVYNSFPKMGDKWIPDDILALTPTWKNFTENPTTVQFDHRILGITTFSTIMAMWLLSRNKGLPKRANLAMNILALFAICQVGLGISTLVHHVPTTLAISHQSGSIILLSAATWLTHELKFLKHIPK